MKKKYTRVHIHNYETSMCVDHIFDPSVCKYELYQIQLNQILRVKRR